MFNNNRHYRVAVNGANKVTASVRTDGRNRLQSAKVGHTVTATATGFGSPGSGSMTLSAAGSGGNGAKNLDTLLQGLVPVDSEAQLRRLYQDMYTYDPVCGSAVDMMSTAPFSDFTLTGLDETVLNIYNESIERLTLRNMLPEVSRDYLVNGLYCATLVFDNKRKVFTDSIPFQPAQVEVIGTPLYSRDPLIRIRPDIEMRKFASSSDPYLVRLRQELPPNLVNAFNSGEFSPDPMTTVYLPRKPFPHSIHGVSYLKRALPFYLLEKLMFRGTLVEAGRRMRSTFHVQAGDETWEPNPEELSAITQMFQQAELDPMGAIVTTRRGVDTSEVRSAGDFWKYTDILGDTTTQKLRALCISEGFLGSEQTYATAEVALSTFLESVKSYRDQVTQALFYNKLFPVIAVANSLFKNPEDARNIRRYQDFGFAVNDASALKIPEVRWHKSLQAKNDRDTFDMLTALAEHDVPVPIRMWVAAGGIEYESLLRDLKQDKVDRDALAKVMPQPEAGADDGGGEFASLFSGHRNRRPRALLARDFGALAEALSYSKTGKPRHVFDQRSARRKENEAIAKALENLSDPNYYQQVLNRVSSRVSRHLY